MSSPLQNLDHLRIPLQDILEATNNFSNENFIRQGGFGKIYKGKLIKRPRELFDVHIVARRLDPKYGQGRKQFFTEILMLSKLKHENLVSLIGFCDEENEKIVVNRYEDEGSLDNYITDPTIAWGKRLDICVGIAHALRYIYYNEQHDFSVVHRNIKSSKILLNSSWVPKLSGFELSMTIKASRRDRICIEDACGSTGYFDPTYIRTGSVSHKSDIYSFGVILFEVLCGKKAITDKRDIKLAKEAKFRYENKHLDDMIDPVLREQMNQESLDILSETAYNCLKEYREGRPDINQVIKKLEKAVQAYRLERNKQLGLLLQPSPEKNLKQHLNFRIRDIEEATNNFADKYCIDSKSPKVYKAQLHNYRLYTSEIKFENNQDLGTKHSIVAIKRYKYTRQDKELFYAETEAQFEHRNLVSILGSCWSKKMMIIVYEHSSNGSLADHLKSTRDMIHFTWVQRLKICIDIAHGLNYIHSNPMYHKKEIHRTISSSNILLRENWEAVIGRFTEFKQFSYMLTADWVTPRRRKDIFDFGIVLFEILCWRLADDPIYKRNNDTGLVSFVRRCYKDGTQSEILDLKLVGEADKDILGKGIDQDSLDTFSKIAYQCLGDNDQLLPTTELVLTELEKALYLQESKEEKNNHQISLADIKSATQDFNNKNLIGEGGFGQVYIGELLWASGQQMIAAKRLSRMSDQGETELMTELVILSEYKHMNVIDLVSYCTENGEKVIVYGYAAKGSLDRWLSHRELTWRKRLGICIDIARGLNFLHGTSDVKQEVVIHRDIKSANILLHDDWRAIIADFGLSLISPINRDINYVIDIVKGTRGYLDPIYWKSGVLTKESDIYSFGVLLFEMLCGRFVGHSSSGAPNLIDLVRHHFQEGTLYTVVFEASKKQMAPKSFTTFLYIAYQCIHEERSKRPTAYDVLIQLQKALEPQDKWEDLNISLDEIMLDTQYFSRDNLIDKGDFWSVYKGRGTCADGCEIIAVKQLDIMSDQGETQHMAEIEVLLEYTHENIISLVGHCNEKGEKIMVYKYASLSKGSLDRWLKYDGLTWRKRLEICIDIARGLAFLHGTSGTKQEVIIHGDIKSANALLNDDLKAIIANFGCSLICPVNQEMKYVMNKGKGTSEYCDPQYTTTGDLTKESDMYSFGVLLFEMLCGRFVMEHNSSKAQNLVHMVKRHFEEGKLSQMVFEAAKKQIVHESFITFQNIAYKCILEERARRPTATDVLIQLNKALDFQVEIEIWEPKLPRDLGKIIQMTSSPEFYYAMSNKDICTSLHKGLLLRENRVWFSLGTDGRRVEEVSAKEFHFKSYFGPQNWIPTPDSRFPQVAWISDSSKMNIRIKIMAHLLSPGVNYGVNLLFKFCRPRENSDASIDLDYHIGNKFLRSHCTTERDDGWLMKELFQFSSLAEEAAIDVFLLGFSESHFQYQAIYVEGIEFRAINNMTHDEMEELKSVGVANVEQAPTDEGHWKVNMAEVKELPADKGGHVYRIVPWLLEKCCG